jgi:hypothetical protein
MEHARPEPPVWFGIAFTSIGPSDTDTTPLRPAVACRADERRKLERLCRYVARPAIALERLNRDGDGLVVYELKHAFRDGTTHVCCTGMYECRGRRDAGSGLFEPLDFIARLAALVPHPRTHLVRFHGLFAPHARHRRYDADPVHAPCPAAVRLRSAPGGRLLARPVRHTGCHDGVREATFAVSASGDTLRAIRAPAELATSSPPSRYRLRPRINGPSKLLSAR